MNELKSFLLGMSSRQLRKYVERGFKKHELLLPLGERNRGERPYSWLDSLARSIWAIDRWGMESDCGKQAYEMLATCFHADPNIRQDLQEKYDRSCIEHKLRMRAPIIDAICCEM
jgi:hypothetical protein